MRYILTLLVFLASILPASAFLEIEVNDGNFGAMGVNPDPSDYPRFTLEIKVTHNSQPVEVSADEIMIIENNTAAVPVSVSPPQNGFQTIKWVTRLNAPVQPMTLVVSTMGESNWYPLMLGMEQIPYIRFHDYKNTVVNFPTENIHYKIKLNEQQSDYFTIKPTNMFLGDNNKEIPVMLDSIVSTNPDIGYSWSGSDIDTDSKTCGGKNYPLLSTYYAFFLNYTAKTTEYFQDRLTAYYQSGRQSHLMLIGNTFRIHKDTTNIVVTYPNGGEQFTPCQEIMLQWSGGAKDLITSLSYIPDDESDPIYIGQSRTNEYSWTVPNLISDSVKFKIEKSFSKSEMQYLNYGNSPVRKVRFSPDAEKLLSAYGNADIVEWELDSNTVLTVYKLSDLDSLHKTYVYPLGIDYINDTTQVAFLYAYSDGFSRYDTLAIFDVGTSAPVRKIGLPSGFYAKEMQVDPKMELLAIIPELSKTLRIYSAKDQEFIQQVDFEAPISAFRFHLLEPRAVVALYQGTVHTLDLPDFTIDKTIDLSFLEIIRKIDIAPTKELIAIGMTQSQSQGVLGNNTYSHIVDIETGYIVRSIKRGASPIMYMGFSPISTELFIALQSSPQLAYYQIADNPPGAPSNFGGHGGELSDCDFNRTHNAIVTATPYTSDNLAIQYFTFKEQDVSNDYFSIVDPQPIIEPIEIDDRHLGTIEEFTYTENVTNDQEIPIFIYDMFMMHDRHFHIVNPVVPDTLLPGETLELTFEYHPLDTGLVTDTLILISCEKEFYVPVSSHGIPRDIHFFPIDFGEYCVGEHLDKFFVVLRNDDPVPLMINGYKVLPDSANEPVQFSVVSAIYDTMLAPGATLELELRFSPLQLGPISQQLMVYHSNQVGYKAISRLNGTGSGTIFEVSPDDLRFIPGVSERSFTVYNESQYQMSITQVVFEPEDMCGLVSQLPIPMSGFDSTEITVNWNYLYDDDGTIKIITTPCGMGRLVTAGRYSGKSDMTIPYVEAEPNGKAYIPLKFVNSVSGPYDKGRTVEMLFTTNPRMFFPEGATSQYGDAEIYRNEVDHAADRRIIGVRITGNLPEHGTAATVVGAAGLSENDSCDLDFLPGAGYWGNYVDNYFNSGRLQLINTKGRLLIRPEAVQIIGISPNPVSNGFTLEFESPAIGEGFIQMVDNLGNIVYQEKMEQVFEGRNTIQITPARLNSGVYSLKLVTANSFDSAPVIMIK